MSIPTPIRIYGTEWCTDCHRARAFFEQRRIPYVWIDPDQESEAEQFVLRINQGLRSVPTIVFPDGSILVEPSVADLIAKFEDLGQT
ncbi:MAG: NrdH-redoxin [Anaerolineales bacterium]|nr:NrdH-redoxin [Anaerolineales bacterium]